MDVSPDEKQRIREKIEKLKQSKFKQQTLPAWRPVPTAMSTMFTFSIFSVIFLAIGVVLYVMSDQIIELETRYDEDCHDMLRKTDSQGNPVKCKINFQILENEIEGPIYVFYQLDNFYQNHRRYVKSRDNEQLAGKYKEVEQLKSTCDPIYKVEHLWDNQKKNLNNQPLADDAPAIPCGLVAKSIFNDTFELWRVGENGKSNERIQINDGNIAWSSDVTYKFKNVENQGDKTFMDLQWLRMTNQHFIVWMRTAGLPNFRKLWGRIEGPMKAGSYYLQIDNQYEVEPFQGKKSFVISTTNALGGKNYFLAICYITVGTLCMLFSFVFCVAYMKKRNTNANQQ